MRNNKETQKLCLHMNIWCRWTINFAPEKNYNKYSDPTFQKCVYNDFC